LSPSNAALASLFDGGADDALAAAMRSRRRGGGGGGPAMVSAHHVLTKMHVSESWRADNVWITDHYRVRHGFGDAVRSFFTFHNDSWNVWTHAFGSAVFVALLAVLASAGPGALPYVPLASDPHGAAAAAAARLSGGGGGVGGGAPPVWPLALFMATAATCMGVSAAYHLLHVVDERFYSVLARLDYASIGLLTWGSFIALITYAFACAPAAVWLFYAGLATLSNGACVAVSLIERFRTADWRLVRMSLFIATGAVGVLPFAHILATPEARQPTAEACVLVMGALYIGGALLYGFRVPERFLPGAFDRSIFASHTVFHIAVFLACCAHLNALLAFFHFRGDTAGTCSAAAAAPGASWPWA
jgi:adiponectin receptor